MFYLIDLKEFLSLVAVATFDCMSRNFCPYYFSFYFPKSSYLKLQIANFSYSFITYSQVYQERENLLDHYQEWNAILKSVEFTTDFDSSKYYFE